MRPQAARDGDSTTCCIASWRPCRGRNPWRAREGQAFASDDDRESGIAFRTYSKRPSREPRMLRQGARTLERPRLNSPSQGANAAVSVTWTSWIVHAGTYNTLKRARREHPQNGFRSPGPCGTPTVAARILTWRARRRRLEVWLTHTAFIFDSISGRTRRRPSKRGTNSTDGGRRSAWTSGCSTKWTGRRAPGRTTGHRIRRKNPQLRPKKGLRQRPRPKQGVSLANPKGQKRKRQSPKPPPTARWVCWFGSIFLLTKGFPSSAGSHGFPPRNRSKARRRR